jgi:uncharacterized membrane protein
VAGVLAMHWRCGFHLLPLTGALALAACTPDGPLGGQPTEVECPDEGTELSFVEFGQPFMESYCLGCHSAAAVGPERHGAPSDHNFDHREEILAEAEHVELAAGAGAEVTNEVMPPEDPRPSRAERMMLSEWLACGAP